MPEMPGRLSILGGLAPGGVRYNTAHSTHIPEIAMGAGIAHLAIRALAHSSN